MKKGRKKRRHCDKGSIRLGKGNQDEGRKLRNEIVPNWCTLNSLQKLVSLRS